MKDAVLNQFHEDIRLNFVAEPGYIVLKEPPVIRLVRTQKKGAPFNMILHSDLNDANADATIEREIVFFSKRNEGFEWKLYDYDEPKDLAERLSAHGLKPGDDEALLIASTSKASPIKLANGYRIEKIEAADKMRKLLTTVFEEETNPEHLEGLMDNLSTHLKESPKTLGIYGAYHNDSPVSAGWAFYYPHSRFCGFFGGTTHSAHRGKGLYKALVHARSEEARQKGFPYSWVDSGPLSQPILKKLGYHQHATMHSYHWN